MTEFKKKGDNMKRDDTFRILGAAVLLAIILITAISVVMGKVESIWDIAVAIFALVALGFMFFLADSAVNKKKD